MYTPAYQKVRELIMLKKWITKAKTCHDIAALLVKWLEHAPITRIKTSDFVRNDSNSIIVAHFSMRFYVFLRKFEWIWI